MNYIVESIRAFFNAKQVKTIKIFSLVLLLVMTASGRHRPNLIHQMQSGNVYVLKTDRIADSVDGFSYIVSKDSPLMTFACHERMNALCLAYSYLCK